VDPYRSRPSTKRVLRSPRSHEDTQAFLAVVASLHTRSRDGVAITTAGAPGDPRAARVVWVNRALLALTGYAESELVGAPATKLLPGQTPTGRGGSELLQDCLDRAIAGGPERPGKAAASDDESIWATSTSESFSAFRDESGVVIYYLVTQRAR